MLVNHIFLNFINQVKSILLFKKPENSGFLGLA